jgi:hypothetical protein
MDLLLSAAFIEGPAALGSPWGRGRMTEHRLAGIGSREEGAVLHLTASLGDVGTVRSRAV